MTARRRYDLVVGILGLDRARADAWTVARTLQNTLWNVEDGEYAIDPVQRLIADTIVNRPRRTPSGPVRP